MAVGLACWVFRDSIVGSAFGSGGWRCGKLTLPLSVRIYVAAQPVDARKSFDGLVIEADCKVRGQSTEPHPITLIRSALRGALMGSSGSAH